VEAAIQRSQEGGHDPLIEAQDRFIATWGQMGSAWGISRTMAEIHALLYVTGESMNTDDVMERLEISRGNASMSLRALVDWNLVTRTHRRGDRKEYFIAEADVWTMFRTIVRERLKREVEPLLAALHEIRDMTANEPGRDVDAERRAEVSLHHERLDEMLEAIELVDKVSQRFVSPSGKGLKLAAAALARI
jgi:DNA-binding transcriptional regulator GbsR (MarR family)